MNRTSALPVWKKLLFAAATMTILFAATESAMTLLGVKPLLVTEDPFVGFAENIPLFAEQPQPDGKVMLATAVNKLGYFNAQHFPKIKAPGTYRIFCLGGSTTYGHPFEDTTSFCGWLREFLPAADPSRNWEVVNAGGISYASYRVANLMNELARYEPDLFIVYTGQNEFLEERTYRSVRGIPRWIISAKVILSKSRIFSIMTSVLAPSEKRRQKHDPASAILAGEVREILNDTIGPTTYTRNEELKRDVLAHFKFNLRRMISIANSSASRILFIVPASNAKDMSPFKSENKSGIAAADRSAWAILYQEGRELQKNGKTGAALGRYREAIRIDDAYADLHFRTGRVLVSLNRYGEAGRSFQRAIDEDICPLRAATPFVSAVRETPDGSGALLVDFEKLLKADCLRRYGHEVLGKEYFLDHVHPTIEGNRMLAIALVDRLQRDHIVDTGPAWNDDTIAVISRRVEGSLDAKKKAYALLILGKTLDWAGRLEEGARLLEQSSRMFRDNSYDVLGLLANSAARRGRAGKAVAYYREALRYDPEDGKARFYLAYYLQEQGKLDDALAQYAESIRVNTTAEKTSAKRADGGLPATESPEENVINAYCNMAAILTQKGRTKEALEQYEEVLRRRPDHAASLMRMGVLLAKEGRDDEALERLTEAIRLQPDQASAHYNVALVYDRQNKLDKAAEHLREAIRLDTSSVDARNNLGVVYAKEGKFEDASEQFRAALALAPDNADAHYNLALSLARLGMREEAEIHRREAERIRECRGKAARSGR